MVVNLSLQIYRNLKDNTIQYNSISSIKIPQRIDIFTT